MADTSTSALQELSRAVRAERQAQGLTQRDLAQRAGISPLTVIAAEKGEVEPRPLTLNRLDRGLGWELGTASSILAMTGVAPPPGSVRSPAPVPEHNAEPTELLERLARIEAKIDALLALAVGRSRGGRGAE